MVHKKEGGTYHHIEKLMEEMPGFPQAFPDSSGISSWEMLASPLNS